jgi:hypothetical protein
MEYRIRKQVYIINDTWPEDELRPREIVTTFAVQVKSLFFWRTVKEFKKIRPANELLTLLNKEEQ